MYAQGYILHIFPFKRQVQLHKVLITFNTSIFTDCTSNTCLFRPLPFTTQASISTLTYLKFQVTYMTIMDLAHHRVHELNYTLSSHNTSVGTID